ncbi:hypothetical protein BDD12DRAFT_881161 [Trichophaea hybrida]|nr:hypothetical protein BDD12DRAFT_881161 [Trichophaea hybrida]
MSLSRPFKTLVSSFQELLCGERKAVEQTRPMLFVAWGLGKMIVSEAISRATTLPEFEGIRRAAGRVVIDVENMVRFAFVPKKRKLSPKLLGLQLGIQLGVGTSTRSTTSSPAIPAFNMAHSWPIIGVGKRLNDFSKSLRVLWDEFGIPLIAIGRPGRTHSSL